MLLIHSAFELEEDAALWADLLQSVDKMIMTS